MIMTLTPFTLALKTIFSAIVLQWCCVRMGAKLQNRNMNLCFVDLVTFTLAPVRIGTVGFTCCDQL